MIRLGLIVEDSSDAEVIELLARKIAKKKFAVRSMYGGGCGHILAKSRAWSQVLKAQGCTLLMVVCDLDENALADHRNALKGSLHPSAIAKHEIVVPVKEIEAWLLADHAAITKALGLPQKANKQANPESVGDPKKRLFEIVRERSRKRTTYLNTVHNRQIAKEAELSNLRRCKSFSPFEVFIQTHLR